MQNSNEKIAGWIALVVTSLYTSISLPIQIFKITQTKDVGSLSLFMVVMLTLTFFLGLCMQFSNLNGTGLSLYQILLDLFVQSSFFFNL